jgi:hypothetical protein
MKKTAFFLLLVLMALSAVMARPVLAQTETPPVGPTGKVTGTIVNRNSGKLVSESLEVMLHILDQDLAELDMKHSQSQPDGKFAFTEVPFDASMQYAVMAIFDGVTYVSDTTPANMTSLQTAMDVPVYDSTSDPASMQVDQMHVLFGIAEDGLEIKEIYAFTNTGERTVKDVYKLEGDKFATLKFPLPADADFIFFNPEDKDRFVKFSGGFADTYPVLPGESSQIMVSYLVPYSGEKTYTYMAPLNIARINFLMPDQVNISLKGSGLIGPESVNLQDKGSYLIYSYTDLKAGQTVSVSIGGKTDSAPSNRKSNNPFAIGAAFLGLFAIGAGVWWWRRPDDTDEETGNRPDAEMDLDQTINEIARLDEVHEKGEIDEEEYCESRDVLRRKAKALLDYENKEI